MLYGSAAESRVTWRQLACFHLLAPVLCSLPQGFSSPGLQFSLPVSLLWWAATWTVAWTCNEVFTRLAAAAARPWRPPLWVVLLIGSCIAGFTSRFWTVPLFDLVSLLEMPPNGEMYRTVPRDLSDPAYVARLAQALVSGSVAWLVANSLFERLTGVVRFPESTAPRAWRQSRPESLAVPTVPMPAVAIPADAPPVVMPLAPAASPAPAAAPGFEVAPSPEPRFLARMTRFPGTRIADVHAVEAEDHYVKVHTSAGAELVYYRFADALEDLRAHDGLQVHRSFWVRRGAIERVDVTGRQWEVVVPRGLRVPVSRANQGALRLAGLVR
jgi:hypothetical protein